MGSAHAPPHCTVHCANQPTLPRQGDQGLTGSAQADVRRHTPKVQTTVCMCDKCIAARVRPHASACRTSPSRRGSTCISLGTSSKSRCAPRGRGWSRGPEERARARRAGQPAPDPNPSPNPHPNPTQDLTTDFGDGIKLIKLVENISEEVEGMLTNPHPNHHPPPSPSPLTAHRSPLTTHLSPFTLARSRRARSPCSSCRRRSQRARVNSSSSRTSTR